MTTTVIETNGCEPVTVQHNSDWSGEASATWWEWQNLETRAGQWRNARLPGRVLVELARTAAVDYLKSKVIAALEGDE